MFEGNYPEEEEGGEEECEERCKEVKRNDPEGEKNEEEEESRKEVKWNDPEEEGKEVDDKVDQEGEAKTDAHRYWEKFSNIFPFPVEKQNCHFEPKKICEVKMKTHPKKAKKYNYTKDCKEQPREIRDQCEKNSIQPLCNTQERLVRTDELVDRSQEFGRHENSTRPTEETGTNVGLCDQMNANALFYIYCVFVFSLF